MQSTVSPTRRKAGCGSRTRKSATHVEQTPDAEGRSRRAFRVLAASQMNEDANLILKKAKELDELLESFLADHNDDTLRAELLRGFGGEDLPALPWSLRELAGAMLEDARGFRWPVGMFISIFGTQVLPTPEERRRYAVEPAHEELTSEAK